MDPRHAHPLLETLVRLDQGTIALSEVDRQDLEPVHALCPECARRLAESPERQRRQAERDDGVEAIENAWLETPEMRSRLEGDRNCAKVEVETLLDLDPEDRLAKVQNAYKYYRTPAFVERMIEQARIWIHHDCKEALALLALAEAALPRIRRETYGERYPHRLALRVLARQGNALRVLGDLRAAEAKLKEVGRRLIRLPTGDRARALAPRALPAAREVRVARYSFSHSPSL